jgi:hypothetical protein
MLVEHENPTGEAMSFECDRPNLTVQPAESPRLDFRHASSHISQKRPGYYLILLRTELKHRSLREKPTLIG